jgi:hypothetical protein
VAVLFARSTTALHAQDQGGSVTIVPTNPIDSFFKTNHLTLAQSVFDKNSIQKPAAFQFVLPSGGTNSYAIDAGLTWNGLYGEWLGSLWEVGPSIEYHRNTQTKTPQNTFQAGLSIVDGFGDPATVFHYVQAVVKYKNDRINSGQGAQVFLSYTLANWDLAVGFARGPGSLQYMWQPTVGIQYESADDVFKTKRSGEVGRVKGHLEAGLYPFGEKLQKSIELVAQETYWYDAAQEGAYDGRQRGHNLFQASGTYWIDATHNIGIGTDYSRGDNPEQGLARQETVILSLKAKF